MSKHTCMMITAAPNQKRFLSALSYLKDQLDQLANVQQIFFYADAVVVASLDEYPRHLEELIALSDQYQIDLYVCSAAFQARSFQITDRANEDFQFMGLGQFVVCSKKADELGVF